MNIETLLVEEISQTLHHLYGEIIGLKVSLEKTKPTFNGDFTLVVFPFVRYSKSSPEETAKQIGEVLCKKEEIFSSYNVIKGFLNLNISTTLWLNYFNQFEATSTDTLKGQKIMIEYSSPNTNKPLHLGHIRNNLLGYSLSQIMKANGADVIMANLINDRGIHICKSMLAWQRFGNWETPESAAIKGDHLVGKYYVVFENKLVEATSEAIENAYHGNWTSDDNTINERYRDLLTRLSEAEEDKQISKIKGLIKDLVRNQSELMQSCQEMLRKWEAGDEEILQLWSTMNSWVYDGFDSTYKNLGVSFDKFYYESNTYTLGKDIVQEGLANGVFFKKEDHSVWIDLSDEGLDEKLVQRGDGTSVYITQDMGTAELKYKDFNIDRSIYVVGNEQDYHFKVLFLVMKKLGRPYAEGMYHASYGMVDLPSGKMKSREGTVVDADDLLQEMYNTSKAKTEELGKTQGMDESELDLLYKKLSLAALKFFILKVDARKRMLFNPEDSIDFQGDTGPFAMYTYARIKSILRQEEAENSILPKVELHSTEIDVIKTLSEYSSILNTAANEYNPSGLCQYILDLAKSFNRLYNELSILKEPDLQKKNFRLQLAKKTSDTLSHSMGLLGIEMVERM